MEKVRESLNFFQIFDGNPERDFTNRNVASDRLEISTTVNLIGLI